MLQIKNAAELYRNDVGSYPVNVQVLVPTYIPTAPVNPFTNATSTYVVGTEVLNLYCSGTTFNPANNEKGKFFVYSQQSATNTPKGLFSKYAAFSNSQIYDGNNSYSNDIFPCAE